MQLTEIDLKIAKAKLALAEAEVAAIDAHGQALSIEREIEAFASYEERITKVTGSIPGSTAGGEACP